MRKDANLGAKGNPTQPELPTLDFKGLYTWPNPFSEVPPGALNVASNCVIDRPGIIDERRGYGQYATGYTAALQGLTFGNQSGVTIEHLSNDTIAVDTNGNGSLMTILPGTYTVPDTTNVESRVTFLNVNANLYFTSGAGIYKLESSTSTPRLAGAPAALGGQGSAVGPSGFLANNTNVAYRVVWLYIDLNGNLVLGPPSERIVVANSTGGTANVSLTFTVPIGVDTTWTFQVYRSNASADLASTPDDNLQLVYSNSPTAGEITARQVTITENRPDVLKGATLYTTTQGIQNANYRPPLAKSIALFKGYTFYANTVRAQTFFLTLISGSLLQNGDTIKFYRGATLLFTLTGGAAENTATGTFLVATGGSASQNITNTAISIVRVVNLYASNTWFDAFYTSGELDSPGKMQFTDRTPNQTQFNMVCSRAGSVFTPILPTSGITNTNVSTNDAHTNYLFFSKEQQPEAVPLGNYIAAGSSSQPIVGIIPLRESLIVIKTDSWYRVVQNGASFSIIPLDVQLRIAAANSAVALNNCVYAFTEQGVVQVQDNGSVKIISLPIQSELLEKTTSNYPGFKGSTWGMAYPFSQAYFLATVQAQVDTTATIVYRYNYITDAWTTWDRAWTAGYVNPTTGNMLVSNYSVSGTTAFQERKLLDQTDFYDEEYPLTITAVAGHTVTVTSAAGVTTGWTLRQGAGTTLVTSLITAVNLGTNVLTLQDDASLFATGAAAAAVPIAFQFETAPIFGGDPTRWKQFTEGSIITQAESLSAINLSFATDQFAQSSIVTANTGAAPGGFGTLPFGTGAFGGSSVTAQERTRFFIPRPTQKANWLKLNVSLAEAFKRVAFSGLQIVARPLSVRQRP